MDNNKIKVAIIGVGSCASALLQGIYYCRHYGTESIGVIHREIGGFQPGDIELVLAWDIDIRKIGIDLSRAIWEKPNASIAFYKDIPDTGVKVAMGRILDGVAPHMKNHPEERAFTISPELEANRDSVIASLKENKVDVMVNFLPVGSELATEFYADCAVEAGVSLVNGIPVFIASDENWANRFKEANLPLIGDDFKAQIGATITHRALASLFKQRGVKLLRTYQLNVGGNSDFLNMLEPDRLVSKRKSKTESVQSVMPTRLHDEDIRIGPSDYVPWLNDNKVAFMRVEGQLLGGVPMNMEVRLSVEDSPNAAAVAIDAIRCAKTGMNKGLSGPLPGPSAFLCKYTADNFDDETAIRMMREFVGANTKA